MPNATSEFTGRSADVAVGDASTLLSALTTSTPSFLQPSSSLHSQSLAYLKSILDPLATDVATDQKSRRDENRKKRKRNEYERDEDILQLRQLYTNGLGVKQVWEQARRILDATCAEVSRDITAQSARQQPDLEDHVTTNGQVQHAQDGNGASEQEFNDLEDGDLDDAPSQDDDLVEDGALKEEEGPEDMSDILEDESDAAESDEQEPETYVQDPNELNDGFFSIDDFNKQTQFLEQQDARGEDDHPSDEDDIDWDADPLTMPFHKSKEGAFGQEEKNPNLFGGGGESSDDEDGPTFGVADFNTHDSDKEVLDREGGALDNGFTGLDNTNDIRYADFFAPPSKRQSRTKRMRALPKTQPQSQSRFQEDDREDDLQRAISDVRRDLLDSYEDESDVGSASDDAHARPSTNNMSTHEKQRAAIAAEIRRLEAASIAKRHWTLSGEARAVDRALNSLIEEDLEFERVGKPVPVITAKVSEEMEQLIKRRILAREFDEVVRRRPDAAGCVDEARRGRMHLDDTKPQSGLAEIYEQEHLKATDPGYVDKRSAATKKQHEEISRLWKSVSNQMDLLSNLHFKPKRVEVEVIAVEDKPTISMEDARPVGVGVNAEESMLAPQEVYRPGEERRNVGDVVIRKGGASLSKEEMTREEKLRRRRREKERTKKSQGKASGGRAASAGDSIGHTKQSKAKRKKQDKSDILSELRKGNVKVIGKKGDLHELDGKKGRSVSNTAVLGGGAFKL